eukprot:jgi/Chrzof1/10975/Cz05g19080.t1
MDIGLKLAIGAGVAFTTAGVIVNPNRKQKDNAALNLFDRPFDRLTPQEARVAEFSAGHKRWKAFWENSVYPLTRRLPGANNPIVNPYKDVEPMGGMEDEE